MYLFNRSFYELPFYSHPNSSGLYGLYEPDVICYCLFVINYLDIIKTFDPSVIVYKIYFSICTKNR